MNGLDIDEKQFMKLKPAERDLLIYKNLRQYTEANNKSKFHLKVQYAWLSLLTAAGATLLGIKQFLK